MTNEDATSQARPNPKGMALVTGASGGLGVEFAEIFAREGHDLLLVARSEEALRKIASQLALRHGVNVRVLACDLTDENAVARIVAHTEELGEHVSILANNAGFGDLGPFASFDIDRQMKMIDLNVKTLTNLTYWYLGPMLDCRQGQILNVASLAAFQPGPLMSTYFATKAYVLSFSEALAEELRGTDVTCTALCPGPVDTAFWSNSHADRIALYSSSFMSAHDVAEYAFESMQRGCVVAVPGAMNKAMACMVRMLPRCLVRRAVHRVLS